MGHSDFICTNNIHLNTTALFNLNSLIFSLILLLVCKSHHIQNLTFCALIDLRSIYYFIDSTFILKHNIPTKPTLSVKLKLFDRSSNNAITKTVFLPVAFPYGDQIILSVYVILLNFSCSLVLRYNWLTQHNSTIDWAIKLSLSGWTHRRKTIFPELFQWFLLPKNLCLAL